MPRWASTAGVGPAEKLLGGLVGLILGLPGDDLEPGDVFEAAARALEARFHVAYALGDLFRALAPEDGVLGPPDGDLAGDLRGASEEKWDARLLDGLGGNHGVGDLVVLPLEGKAIIGPQAV